MKSSSLVLLIALLILPATASAGGTEEVMKRASPLATSQAAVIAGAAIDGKAVPRKDKDAVEVIGTVREVYSVVDPCSGASVIVVWVTSRAAPLNPVGGGCAGPTLAACASLRAGQRIRLQGLLLTLPDPTTDGFDACDSNTWFLPPVPLQTFLVTKVLR